MLSDRNYSITVEAADHGKPVKSATALIHIILNPPPPNKDEQKLVAPATETAKEAHDDLPGLQHLLDAQNDLEQDVPKRDIA